jgi:hypothetical protein
MPFIKISTLPNHLNKAEIMKNVENALYNCEFEGKKLMPVNMATCIWQTEDCVVHKLEAHKKFDPKAIEIPVFVDLYVNTIFSKPKVGKIMEIIGEELSKGTGIDARYVFIHTHVGNPGYIFINGEVGNG